MMETLGPHGAQDGEADLWPTQPSEAVANGTVIRVGDTVTGLAGDQVPVVIGRALEQQDMIRTDQVVLGLAVDEGGAEPRFTVEILEFREPGLPPGPYWFAQYLSAFIEALVHEGALAPGKGPLRVCADRGGLFWLADPGDRDKAASIGWAPRG